MKTLYMMVGLPRSGKTSAIQRWGDRFLSIPLDAAIVSPDAIRIALHGQIYIAEAEPVVWAIAKIMTAALFEAGHNAVILDACNNTIDRRNEWKDKRWRRYFIVLDTPADVCIQRAQGDGREDLIPIIERMSKTHEPVTIEEVNHNELTRLIASRP